MGPNLHIILVTVQDTIPTRGTRHRFLIPGARLALKHLSVAINKQLRRKLTNDDLHKSFLGISFGKAD